jgi:hypothetical protein
VKIPSPFSNIAATWLVSLVSLTVSASARQAAAGDQAVVVTHEAYGAVGDGVADDLPAILKAHAHANKHGLRVRSKPDATDHLGHRALTAIVATDTDWGTSRFIIDDSQGVEARPIDPEPLFLGGGVFINIANRMKREKGSSYWGRNILISRSKTLVDGVINRVIDGMHDFGYPCFMPRVIRIEGLFIEDSKPSRDYHGVCFFSDPIGTPRGKLPFPYRLTERLEHRRVETASGLPIRVCANPEVTEAIHVVSKSKGSSAASLGAGTNH